MRFRKDKDGGDAGASGAGAAAPPDASTRVADPLEAAGESTKQAEAPEPHGDPLSPLTPGSDGPQSPGPDEPAKVLPPEDGEAPSAAAPPTAETRVDAPPPSEAAREDGPRPSEPAKVLASPPPSAAARVDAPPPQPGQLVSAAPPAAAQSACPQCGTPAEAGQEMCIACGSRIAREPVAGGGRDWKLPAALAGLGVLLIGVAIAFGIVELTRDDDVKKDDVADLSPTTTTPPGTPPPGTPPPASTTPATPTIPPATREPEPQDPSDTTTPDTPSPSSSGPAEWPDGRTAYTVVLVSATNRNAADAKAEQAVKRGIEAGVLRSDDFSSLRPGFWVVFAGQFDSSEEATRAADRYAEQGFGGGYPRQVKPK